MVLVTPYIVRAVAQKDLSRPDDGFADPSDPAQSCSAISTASTASAARLDPPPNGYHGKYGFILD